MKIYEIDFDCFEVTEPDGGGIKSNHIAYFTSNSVAEEFVKKTDKGWPKDIKESKIKQRFVVLESLEDYDNLKQDSLRQSALSKLTPEEIKALGL